MCSAAQLSRMPVLPDTDCLRSFGDLGRECVLDLNAGEMHTPVWTAWMWFGDDSSRAAVSALLWGGVAVCHSRAGARHRLRGKLIFPRARGARQNRAI